MHYVESLIGAIPPYAVYLLVFVIIGLESMGIPLPGEIVLVSSSLLAAHGTISPWGVAIAASAGAIIGDSVGYTLGRCGGRALLERLGRRFPRHFGSGQIARAERAFERWGIWTVFFGRFVALLRILAGPIAGSLRMPYWRFLLANMGGGILWAGGTTFVVYYLGRAAERWLASVSWGMLLLMVLAGFTTFYLVRRSRRRAATSVSRPPTAPGGSAAGSHSGTTRPDGEMASSGQDKP